MTDLVDEVPRDRIAGTSDLAEAWSPLETRPEPRRPASPGTWLLAALLAGAGIIHLVMVPVHWGESTVDGALFLVAGWVQLALAVLTVVRRTRVVLVAAIVTSGACLAAWIVSRTVGLPVGAHAGASEPVGFVDGVAAALELAAIVVAVVLLAVAPALGGGRRRAGPVIAASLGALALTAAAIASPSARTHGGADHGHADEAADGHAHEDPAGGVDDLGFAALANGQMGDHSHGGSGATAVAEPSIESADVGALSEQLALTAPLVAAYPTLADAEAAGYRQAGPFSPGLGIHYNPPTYSSTNGDGVMDPADIANAILIYDGIEDDARLAGFMYMAYQETEPDGFVGDLDRWHYHTAVCVVFGPDGIDTPFGADLTGITPEMCEAEGGAFLDFTGYMVHVWTVPGYESELGVFSDLNPALTCPDGTYHRIPTAEIGDADTTCLDSEV